MRRRLTARLPLLAGALVLLLGRGAGGEVRELDLPLPPGGVVLLEVDFGEGLRPDSGHVRVLSHDSDEVRLRVEVSGWGSWGVEASLVADGPGRARIEVWVDGPTSWLFGGPRLRVDVRLPRGTNLDVRSAGGALRIGPLVGGVRARASDGDVEIRDVEGDVKLRTVNGDALVEEVSGSADLSSSNGDIEVAWVSGDCSARTTGGEIRMRQVDGHVYARTLEGAIFLDEVAGPVEARTGRGSIQARFRGAPSGSLETERGSVEVTIPDGSSAEIDASTTRGQVELGPRVALDGDVGPSHARGQLGEGGGLLILRTSQGAVRVSQR